MSMPIDSNVTLILAAIGASIAILLLIACLGFVALRWRRKKQRQTHVDKSENDTERPYAQPIVMRHYTAMPESPREHVKEIVSAPYSPAPLTTDIARVTVPSPSQHYTNLKF
jgi:type IV secretory pathway VirB10-like protein